MLRLLKGVALAGIVIFASAAFPKASMAAEPVKQQADTVFRKVANWVPNLVMDFVDIFKADVAVGTGAGIDLRLTRLAEAGYDDYNVTRYGLNGRHSPVWPEQITDGGIGILGFTSGTLERDPYDVAFTVNIGGGAEFGFNLYKILDFGSGILFMDLEKDNKNYIE